MGKTIVNSAIAIAIIGVGIAVVYFFYQKAQTASATAQSVALNNQYFQQQIQTQELQGLVGTYGAAGSNSTTIGGTIVPTNTGATPS